MTASSLFRSSCTANEKQKFNKNTNISSFAFVGSGNATRCRQRLKKLFDSKRNDKTVNCTYKPEYCTFDHAFQPLIPDKINFVGLSGYFYVFQSLAHGIKNKLIKTKMFQNYDYFCRYDKARWIIR